MPFKWKSLEGLALCLIMLFYALMLTFAIELPAAEDLGRHLKNGEMVLKGQFDVLYTNFYSYTMPDEPFVNHHWLAGVVYYIVHAATGWIGLVIFKIMILLTMFWLLFMASLRKSNFWIVALISIPTLFLLLERATLRPENFSYLFFALYLWMFGRYEENRNIKQLFWLIPAQIFWVNTHIFFILGPALLGAFWLEQVIKKYRAKKNVWSDSDIRKLLMLCVLLGLACLINPNHIYGALYPLNIFTDYGMVVSENQPLKFFRSEYVAGNNISVLLFYPLLAILIVSFLWRNEKSSFLHFIFSGATAYGATQMVRLVAPFGVFLLPAVSANLASLPPLLFQPISKIFKAPLKVLVVLKWLFIAGVFTLVVCKATGVGPYGPMSMGLSKRSEDAAMFYLRNGLSGPIFNDYDVGSYLDYYLFPKERVFQDNRPEAFSAHFFQQIYDRMLAEEDVWNEKLKEYGFNTIFLNLYDKHESLYGFILRRYNDPEWALVFADIYNIIFVRRTPENASIIEKWEITAENVVERMAEMAKSDEYTDQVTAADVCLLAGNYEMGMITFFNVVERWPKSGKIWMVMGKFELTSDNPKSILVAIMYFQKAIDVGYRTAEVYTELGNAYLRIEYFKQAREMAEKALKKNPIWAPAKSLLSEIGNR